MDYLEKIIGDIEEHSVGGIIECFKNGVSPNDQFRNEPLIYELTSEYLRSSRFKECVRAFVEHGLVFEDKMLLSVLLDDPSALEELLRKDANAINKRYTLRCAFTPLHEVSLLHVCAEFNHVESAKVIMKYGADPNAKAGKDQHGFGEQTPIFHTVNQIHDHSCDMLNFLLSESADLHYTVSGFIWGKGYEWETLIPAVNPISYAMMGLLPQMHRSEKTITEVVSLLLEKAYSIDYIEQNMPNKYLKK